MNRTGTNSAGIPDGRPVEAHDEQAAKLARLALSPDEIEAYGAQLTDFLTHVDALRELDTQDVPATAQVIHARNVGREDAVTPCLPRDEVLAGAPQAYGSYFRVPRIIGAEE